MAKPEQEQKQFSYGTFWKKQNAKAPKELPKLADKANKFHNLALDARRDALRYAKECGDALCEARKFFRVKGSGPHKWKDWLKRNFSGPGKSYETVKLYMRISRKWDDPRIKEARQGGLSVDTMTKFLRLLQNRPDAGKGPDIGTDAKNEEADIGKPTEIGKKGRDLSEGMTEREKKMSMMCQELRRECFGTELERLTWTELETMIKAWDWFWPKWYRDVRKTVCQVLEYSPYPSGQQDDNGEPYNDSEEEIDAKMRKHVRNLNARRKRTKGTGNAKR